MKWCTPVAYSNTVSHDHTPPDRIYYLSRDRRGRRGICPSLRIRPDHPGRGRTAGKLAPVELTFDRPAVIGEAVVLALTPGEPLHEFWGEIRNGIAEVTGAAPTAAERVKGFRPQVSLTYINTPGPAQPYVETLSGVEAEPVKVYVDRVALIVQNRVLEPEWVYRWNTHTVVPMGADSAPEWRKGRRGGPGGG
ncbi:2'-5' RNA ligase family protein [Nonomuraea sp. H19]|uniref:2'-5' RNA ligase family protein n=1 Tax=Nonomuraea sp. H19 TaxID=3452206 RepID=UPI003F8887D5